MKVKLEDAVEGIEMQSGESSTYLNKKTGEFYTRGQDETLGFELEDGDDQDDEEELVDEPEWLREERRKWREISGSDDWIQLPTQSDVHEYHIMEQFGAALENAEASNRILRVIRGSGAFRRFKHTLEELGLWEEWNAFKHAELERIAIEWLEENGVEYSR